MYYLELELVARAEISFKAVMNSFEIGMELGENGSKLGVIRTGEELGSEGEEKGNLEGDLVCIDAVEDAIKLSIKKGNIKLFGEGGF